MRAGLTNAWRQRSSAQQDARRNLSAQALVGFLTLVLVVVLAYGSVVLSPSMDVSDLQRQAVEAFQLRVSEAEPDDLPASSTMEVFDSLDDIEGISIHQEGSTLSLLIENDDLFFPETADTKDSEVIWWQQLLARLVAMDQPLRLTYVRQRGEYTAATGERPDLAEQAATVGRLFTAEGLGIEQLDVVERWINPYFEEYGEPKGLGQSSILLIIEMNRVPSNID